MSQALHLSLLVTAASSSWLFAAPAWSQTTPSQLPQETAQQLASAPVTHNWTGCYAGINGGYSFDAKSDVTLDIIIPVAPGVLIPEQTRNSAKTSGAAVGGQIGCNYQFQNHVVIGPELEMWYQDVTGTSAAVAIPAPGEYNSFVLKNHFAGASSLRLGYAFDRLLVYGKVGAAFATIRHSGSNAFQSGPPVDILSVPNHLSVGILGGGGLEYAVTDRISIKGEYNYINFGRGNYGLIAHTDPGTPMADTIYGNTTAHDHEQIVKVGINFRVF
jgi:outer membrane immunogenic protein